MNLFVCETELLWIHAEGHIYVALFYSRSVLLEFDGEFPQDLPRVVAGTILTHGYVNDRGLLS